MKKAAFNIATLAFLMVFASCKNEPKETVVSDLNTAMAVSENEIIKTYDDLSLNSPNNETETHYLYVTAISGLSLREYGNLQSGKLARMPYGTKVKVLTQESNTTMTVAGIKGGMTRSNLITEKDLLLTDSFQNTFLPKEILQRKVMLQHYRKFTQR